MAESNCHLAKRSNIAIPPELLYDIVCIVVAEYIDHTIMGPLDDLCDMGALEDAFLPEDLSLNPIILLFAVLYQVRDVVRKVLSHALGIERGEDGRYSAWFLL